MNRSFCVHALEIDAADVVRLIEQFLKEHSLTRSLRALQEESQVALNVVDNLDAFLKDARKAVTTAQRQKEAAEKDAAATRVQAWFRGLTTRRRGPSATRTKAVLLAEPGAELRRGLLK